MSAKNKWRIIAGIIIISLISGIIAIHKIMTDPDIIFLVSENNAEWIRYPEPFYLVAREPEKITVLFKTQFELKSSPKKSILNFRALKHASVFLDNRLVFQSEPNDNLWKKKYSVDLSITGLLNAGSHELKIAVSNSKGHPALIAECEALKIFTGKFWDASYDGKIWKSAMLVEKQQAVEITRQFERSDIAIRNRAFVFLPIFFIVSVITYLVYLKKIQNSYVTVFTASNIRYFLLILWAAMAANNMFKIPPYIGMDISAHLEYIDYLMKNYRIPLPTEGWQMFQPPLYYVISAIIAKLLFLFLPGNIVALILRIIPLGCGMAQIEICYRTLSYMFPDREDLKTIGTIIGGLLPMNIYISQFVGNEPMTGLFSSIVVLLMIRYLYINMLNQKRSLILIGIFLGLALLSKISACLLIPLLMIGITFTLSHWNFYNYTKRVMTLLFIAFVICGWYYLYSWIGAGKIVLRSTNVEWWQDPGFRIWQHFFLFGESIFYPVYAAIIGFWDSLYSTFWLDGSLSGMVQYAFIPPWNSGFLVSCALFSIVPTIAIFIGMITSARSLLEQKGVFFSACCVIIYTCAILYIYLTLPVYSTAKATYMLGITPCFAVLCASGFDKLMVSHAIRSIIYGIIACWGVSVYLAYFVL